MSTYTGSLKIGTPKNREFWEILTFSKTYDLLKIENFWISKNIDSPKNREFLEIDSHKNFYLTNTI